MYSVHSVVKIVLMRPVSWDAVRRFVQLSKIDALAGSGTHAPSLIGCKNPILGNAFSRRHDSDIDFVLCLQASKKIFTFFSACENDRRGIPTSFHFL